MLGGCWLCWEAAPMLGGCWLPLGIAGYARRLLFALGGCWFPLELLAVLGGSFPVVHAVVWFSYLVASEVWQDFTLFQHFQFYSTCIQTKIVT